MNLLGNWTGSYTINGVGGNTGMFGAINSNGKAMFYDAAGFLYVLPSITGASSKFSGTLTGYAPEGSVFADGQVVKQFSVSGTVASNLISGNFSNNSEMGSFSIQPFSPLTGSIVMPSGTYAGNYGGTTSGTFAVTFAPGGNFTGTDDFGCSLAGNLTQNGSSNVFNVTLNSTGSGCFGSTTGLALESNEDYFGLFGNAPGTYLYLAVSNGTAAAVTVIQIQ